MASRHDPETLKAFLGGESRQVWARDRTSGENVYLDEGQAERMRARTKAELGCIIPTCEALINTRGGSVRDHFYHPGGPNHGGGGVETMHHLASKAMLAAWARSAAPDASAEEEVTLKDEAAQFHRRPDVLVIWTAPLEHQLALEVEYKAFSHDAWHAKQDEFTTQGIACTWLLGHTSVKPTRAKARRWDRTVKVHKQAGIIAAAGQHVLIVNPNTQQIGTLAGDAKFKTKVPPNAARAWLALDNLSDCELTPHGIRTPTTRRIDQAIKERNEAHARRLAEQAKKKRLAEELERRRLAELARLEAERLLKEEADRARMERLRATWAEYAERWRTEPLRTTLEQRWGKLPSIIREFGEKPGSIKAAPEHWHAVLYEGLIHSAAPGSHFTSSKCWELLRAARIGTSPIEEKRVESLQRFLDSLVAAGLIAPEGDGWIVRRRIPVEDSGAASEPREEAVERSTAMDAVAESTPDTRDAVDEIHGSRTPSETPATAPRETAALPRAEASKQLAPTPAKTVTAPPGDQQASPPPTEPPAPTMLGPHEMVETIPTEAAPNRITPSPATPERTMPDRPKKKRLLRRIAAFFTGK